MLHTGPLSWHRYLLENNCSFIHPAVTEQCYHLFGVEISVWCWAGSVLWLFRAENSRKWCYKSSESELKVTIKLRRTFKQCAYFFNEYHIGSIWLQLAINSTEVQNDISIVAWGYGDFWLSKVIFWPTKWVSNEKSPILPTVSQFVLNPKPHITKQYSLAPRYTTSSLLLDFSLISELTCPIVTMWNEILVSNARKLSVVLQLIGQQWKYHKIINIRLGCTIYRF